MKRTLVMVLSLAISATALAQSDSYDRELNNEIDALKITVKKANKKANNSSATTIVAEDLSGEEVSAASGTTIINNNTNTNSAESASAVQKQPVSVVEAAPLEESKIDKVRQGRLEKEKDTEYTILERLEADRVEAEKKRAERAAKMFAEEEEKKKLELEDKNNHFESIEVKQVEASQLNVIKEDKKEEAIEEKPVALAPAAPIGTVETKQDVEEPKKEDTTKLYVSGLGGITDYSGANNVKGIFSAGVSVGVIFPERFILEAGVLFSSYDVDEVWVRDVEMNQQNYSAAFKYQIFDSRIKPIVGVVTSYTRREFKDRYAYNPYYWNGTYYQRGQRPGSSAFDAGFLLGADVELSQNFRVGSEFRYMTNLSYRRDTESPFTYRTFGMTNIEEMSYYNIGITATVLF